MFTGLIERRASCRYPITANLSYAYPGANPSGGHGRLVNVSSTAILFESNGEFRPRMKLKLVIAWPAPAGQSSNLVVSIDGRVIRVLESFTAIAIEAYEFKSMADKI